MTIQRILPVLLAASLPVAAAIEGTVINKTTGKPQPGVTVAFTKLTQQGMAPGGSTKSDASGKFKLEDADAQGAHLVQATYAGVTYNVQLGAGSAAQGVEIPVYESSAAPVKTTVDQHMILVETNGSELVINETLIYKNDSTTTWANPASGTLRFAVPEGVGEQLRVRATAPGGLPVDRTPRAEQRQRGVYRVDFPVKPGETRFDISYKFAVADPIVFKNKILHPEGSVRLVVPEGMTAKGDNIVSLGKEPSTRAEIFDVKEREFSVTLAGTGTLRSMEATQREEDGPRIEQIAPRIYDRLPLILVFAFGILALAFAVNFQKGGQRAVAAPPAAAVPERRGKRKA